MYKGKSSVFYPRMLRVILTLFVINLSSANATDTATGRNRTWIAPNKVLFGSADNFKATGEEDHDWDVVTIRGRDHRLNNTISLKKGSGVSRATVTEAIWSTDSRFFVFRTASSGGHSSWHIPTYVYDAKTGKIYSIDDTFGSVTSDNRPLHFTHGDFLDVDLWNAKWTKDSDPTFFPKELNLTTFVNTARVAGHER